MPRVIKASLLKIIAPTWGDKIDNNKRNLIVKPMPLKAIGIKANRTNSFKIIQLMHKEPKTDNNNLPATWQATILKITQLKTTNNTSRIRTRLYLNTTSNSPNSTQIKILDRQISPHSTRTFKIKSMKEFKDHYQALLEVTSKTCSNTKCLKCTRPHSPCNINKWSCLSFNSYRAKAMSCKRMITNYSAGSPYRSWNTYTSSMRCSMLRYLSWSVIRKVNFKKLKSCAK